ncbi:hypothetical protein BM1_03419 [Bipolaris maydis]|nr:hypothetical protein BM1_03419 [Bipolaris maydis]
MESSSFLIDKDFLTTRRGSATASPTLSNTRNGIAPLCITNHAPQAPIKKRTTARAKSARVARPTTAVLPKPDDMSSFPSTKRDKQRIKHSSFVSKIEKSSAKTQKRRRPNNKLIANLESLADALPGGDTDGDIELGQARILQPKQKMESMKRTKGAKKRKEKLEKLEKARFNANLAQLTTASTNGADAVKDRWAALKSHVQTNMEVRPEFAQQ